MTADLAARDLPRCPVCRMQHITHRRPEGIGFVCRYREPDEHYHDSYEEMRVCQGTATPQMYGRAATALQTRTGTRGKHPRQRRADKPTLPEAGQP